MSINPSPGLPINNSNLRKIILLVVLFTLFMASASQVSCPIGQKPNMNKTACFKCGVAGCSTC